MTPEVLAAIHDLEFVARVTVEGALSGLHVSPFHGYSAEFSQYRHYRPGDDLKYVDWKLFARTDRVYTKQFRETTNMRMQIVLDASASMGFRGVAGVSKFEYARVLAGALAHLVTVQGDAPGVTVYDDRIRAYLASRPGRTHLRSLLVALSNVSPHGGSASVLALRRAVDLLSSRGVIVLLSDLYEAEEEVHAELTHAVRRGHDVSVFHVLSRDEIEWPWDGELEVEDSETGRRVRAGASGAGTYRERMRAFIARGRERCISQGIPYVLAVTDVSPSHLLREYLLHRSAALVR